MTELAPPPQMQSDLWDSPLVLVQRGDIWQLGRHRLMCGNALNGVEVDGLLGSVQPDLIFADPPYGIGIDVWDKPIEDIPLFIELVTRRLKQGGFFAFTQQMPSMLDWLIALRDSSLKYKDHIAWIKRQSAALALPLLRGHESLFIYGYGKADYFTTKGTYSDVKTLGLLFDVITVEGIDRYIKDLQRKANGLGTGIKGHNNSGHKAYSYRPVTSDRSPEFANFTNVWSFLPEQVRTRNRVHEGHATAKPVLLMERLIALCTPEQAIVYDAFLGSGTTLIAGHRTGRTVYGMEISPAYCADIIQRWQEMTCQQAVRLGVA